MSKIEPVTEESASPEQRRIADALYGARGSSSYSGPYSYFLHDPKMTEMANALGDYLRLGGNLSRRHVSIAVTLAVRHWNASYAWSVHSQNALKFGLGEEYVAAVRDRRRPASFTEPADEVLYDYATTLLAGKRIPDALEDRARAAVGVPGLADFVSAMGFYSMIALGCLAFDPQMPAGTPRLPE